MELKKSKLTWFASFAIVAILSLSVLSLTGCGSSSDDSDDSSSNATSAQESTSPTSTDDKSSSSSSDITLDDVEDAMTSGYMGVNEDSGETYYWASNDDGSLVMLAILNTNNGAANATSASYVGDATVNGNNVVVTDYATGNQIGFDVINNGDGTITLDLGDQYGQATIAQCDVSDVFDAFKTIDQYTTAVQ